MGPHKIKITALLLAFVLIVAACGSDDDGEAGDASSDEASAVATTAAVGEEAADDASAIDADTDDEVMEQAMEEAEESAAADGAAPTSTTIAADGARRAAEGGLFGEEEVVEEDAENSTFVDYGIRPFVATSRDPLSTFALDVDTASYNVARRWVEGGQVPPRDSVRVEEYVNSFDYDYPAPNDGLSVVADAGPSPFTEGNVIVRLGVQAEEVANSERPDATLTFVVDTSGSMDRGNRIGLVKTALARLVVELEPADQVAIVTYSDGAAVHLPPTSVEEEGAILDAIDALRTTGSTNLEAGLQRGYELANDAFVPGGINRVVLASDGVANVGLTDPQGLVGLIRDDADRGIQLVTVGVGMGNFNDETMEQLANDGDGFYAYVDNQDEADALFGDELVGTLLTVAIDGKIQVEFDADSVVEYRLLGYENRAVLDDDFRNDEVDAGELGAGHQATALYELKLADGVRPGDSLGTAQLRWEDPETRSVIETRLELSGAILEDRWTATSTDFRVAVTVASLAEILRDSPYRGDVTLDQVAAEAGSMTSERSDLIDFERLVEDLIRLS
ncbi:MAG: von Willebrand factor type A domain-containing protein [Actinomycetota bacterium]